MTLSCHELVPLRVGDLFEGPLISDADVVHEHVDAAEPRFGLVDRAARARRPPTDRRATCSASPTSGASPLRPVVTTLRTLGGEQLRRLEADAAGRAGDDAYGVAQSEIHGWLA